MAEHETGIVPVLEVVEGRANRSALPLDRTKLRLGRGTNNDLVLTDDSASRLHAEIGFEDGQFVITDQRSSNGVWIDEARVERAALKPGQRIRLGSTVLAFRAGASEIPEVRRLALLDGNHVLRALPSQTKVKIAAALTPRSFPTGAVIQRQDTPIESMLFVVSGEIRLVELNVEGGERLVGRLRPGDSYGERSLLPGQAGGATLVADSAVLALELSQGKLSEFIREQPEAQSTVILTVRDLLKSAHAAAPAAAEKAESEAAAAAAKTAEKPEKGAPPAARPERVEKAARGDTLTHLVASTEVVILGEDKRLQALKKKIETLAKADKLPLIVGPSGTGKRTMARHWHRSGPHASEPYVEISLAEVEPVAVESTLFGVEADGGGAQKGGRIGYLEMMGAGTLTIAHAERLNTHQQAKLAAYLKVGWFHRVYGQAPVQSKVRLLLVAEGDEDAVLEKLTPELKALVEGNVIALPALSARAKDIPILAEHFLKIHARREGKRLSGLARETQDKLIAYPWLGNIPELENVIQRAVMIAPNEKLLGPDAIIVIPSEREIHRVNALRNDRVRGLLRQRWIFTALTWFNIAFVLVVLGFTLLGALLSFWGHPLSTFENNPGMLVTWLVWFPVLPITAFFIGRIWCGMCPIVGIGDIVSKVLRFNLPAPRFLKRLDFWTVAAAFLFLDWAEGIFAVPEKPLATATLLIVIIGASVLFCIAFERKTFCRYVCPLASMLGTYSTMSIVEVRGNKKVCQTQCGQHTCFKGTDEVPGCPMFSYPASITTNYECMMCGNCISSCDNRGVQVNVRPPLTEIWQRAEPTFAMSLFAVLLVGVMAHHQFIELAFWKAIEAGFSAPVNILVHTLVFGLFLLLPTIPFVISASLSAAISREGLGRNMGLYGLAFVPLAFAGHISHVAHELLGDGAGELIAFAQRLFELVFKQISLSASQVQAAPLLHPAAVTVLKVLFVTGGLIASTLALLMIAKKTGSHGLVLRTAPHLFLLGTFWIAYMIIFTASTEVPEAPTTPTARLATAPAAR